MINKLSIMFQFREEKYTGENSPGGGLIHFALVDRGWIHN